MSGKTPVYFDPQGPGKRGILKITIKINDLPKFNDPQIIRRSSEAGDI
jgi:hypothetical protein